VLSPSFIIPSNEDQFQINSIPSDLLLEWRQILDLLWSDPKLTDGCEPNTYRGGGCYWGPDVTQKILEKHKWTLLIRSHECKEEGFGYSHDKKVGFVFVSMEYVSFILGANDFLSIKLLCLR
jgi:serine/threonine-protein phosphatase with EF-hand domain